MVEVVQPDLIAAYELASLQKKKLSGCLLPPVPFCAPSDSFPVHLTESQKQPRIADVTANISVEPVASTSKPQGQHILHVFAGPRAHMLLGQVLVVSFMTS
jgi:hypothetical protein